MNATMSLKTKATQWALRTTNARCGLMSECYGKCSKKECDFRSRLYAFISGYHAGAADAMELKEFAPEYLDHED